ncbi:MAG: hypothetical protein BMS9Abin24_098 [Thermodesulfobacteriota bacterium]|nr:MAG: hypothetical protein BMS9Abin24_098 [Thermodesulfobacteriota bacterium]
MTEERLIRVEEGLKTVSDDLGEIKSALKDIASSLRTLAVLEEKHNSVTMSVKRAFKRIDRVVDRVEAIEKTMPNLVLASSWVFKAAMSVMAVLGVAAAGTVARGFFG